MRVMRESSVISERLIRQVTATQAATAMLTSDRSL